MIGFGDGTWVAADAPAVVLTDRGFALGDGLFETILVERGIPVRCGRHHARMCAAARALGLPDPPALEPFVEVARGVVARNGLDAARAAARLAWTAGLGARGLARDPKPAGALFASASPAPLPATPARLAMASIRRSETAPSARWKTLSYIDSVIARREAECAGADEALLLNTRGALACAAAANVFVADPDGGLSTPPLDDAAIPGTVRAALLEAMPAIRVRTISVAELAAAPAIALTNALIGVRPCSQLDGRPLDPDWPAFGALRAALSAAP